MEVHTHETFIPDSPQHAVSLHRSTLHRQRGTCSAVVCQPQWEQLAPGLHTDHVLIRHSAIIDIVISCWCGVIKVIYSKYFNKIPLNSWNFRGKKPTYTNAYDEAVWVWWHSLLSGLMADTKTDHYLYRTKILSWEIKGDQRGPEFLCPFSWEKTSHCWSLVRMGTPLWYYRFYLFIYLLIDKTPFKVIALKLL